MPEKTLYLFSVILDAQAPYFMSGKTIYTSFAIELIHVNA